MNNAVARIAGLVAIALIGVIVGTQLDVGGYHRVAIATAGFLVVGGIVSWIGIRNPAPPEQAESSSEASSERSEGPDASESSSAGHPRARPESRD